MTPGPHSNLGGDISTTSLGETNETTRDPKVGRVIGDRYRLISALGTGASATVYLAEDLSLRRQVAVKLLHPALVGDPKFRRRFRAEAQSAAQMSHPHLMAVHDWGDEDEAYLVTELLPGGSLRQMIDDGFRLSPSQALVVGLHAAEGLAHAHSQGFVHRDIKPANLLFGVDGRLRVADFGIARAVAEAAWTEPEGALIGTARYAAPEQAAGSNVDGRADVYSLALTLIEGVTGEVPLIEATPLATMLVRQDQDIPRVASLGPLADVIQAAGQVDREVRPTSAEFVRALTSAAAGLPRPKRLPLVGPSQRSGGDSGPVTGVVDLRRDGSPVVELNTAEYQRHDSIENYMDLEQTPTPSAKRRKWPWLVMVALLLASGVAIVRYATAESLFAPDPIVIPTHPVGTFVGGSVEDARRDIGLANLTVNVFERHQDGSVVGEVLEQTPDPGFVLEEGREVTLWVSLGPELRTVPPLVGLTLAQARDLFLDSGLVIGSVGNEFDEIAVPGSILSASVEPGVELEIGSRVDLVLSGGPAKRIAPALESLTPEVAAAILTELGLVYAESEERQSSETVPEGSIVSVDVAAGTEVDRDSTVTVVVSSGLPFIEIPDLRDKTGAQATTILEDLGFKVVATIGSPNGNVLQTDPPMGEFVRKGTEITILVRS